ncbi:MAG: aldehyde reductase, partial [Pseudomonadota bacterium]
WDLMAQEKPGFDLVVINPFLVIGPAHTKAINTSNQTFVDIINGQYPAVMALEWGFVDVRDVADAHIAAMDAKVSSGRYIAASANLDMAAAVDLMRQEGFGAAKLPKVKLTGWLGTAFMKLASRTQPAGIGSYLRTHLGRVPHFDNSKIRKAMGITFRTPEDSIKDTLSDLARWGHIPAPEAAGE